MKDLSIEDFEVLLCSTGCLPPRNEDELSFFCEMYEGRQSCLENRHVDIDAILSGRCRMEPEFDLYETTSIHQDTMVAESDYVRYSMAARNFEKLPKEVLDKMRKQHNQYDDGKD